MADFDLAVIGGGSAGLSVTAVAAQLGVKVVLIERRRMGGDCLSTDCVPGKGFGRRPRWAEVLHRRARQGRRRRASSPRVPHRHAHPPRFRRALWRDNPVILRTKIRLRNFLRPVAAGWQDGVVNGTAIDHPQPVARAGIADHERPDIGLPRPLSAQTIPGEFIVRQTSPAQLATRK